MSQSKNSKLTLFTLLLTSTLTVMAGATIAPALPAMQEQFNSVENAEFWVRLVLTIPGLFIVLGAFAAGALIDRYSKKKFLISCMIVYALAGSSGLFLDSLFAILAGRAIMGLGVAGIMTTVITLFSDYYSGNERARALGMQSSFMALGGVIFLTTGGFLADLSWRFPFAIYLSALLFVPLAIRFLYEPERSTNEPTTDDSASIISASDLLKLLVLVYGLILSAQIIFYTIPIHLPFFLMDTFNASATSSGLAIGLVTLFAGITSLCYGWIKHRIGYVYILVSAFLLLSIGYISISFADNLWFLVFGLIIIGVGFGLFMPNVNTWLAEVAPEKFRGRVMGGITTFVFLGQFLSPIATQPIQVSLDIPGLYLSSGGFLAITALLLLFFRNPLIALCRRISTS
ncbi:MAG: MFS transporter [Balneolaceae bacterium]|nr:MFS transporter [Balneolaceae bacterium]